MEAGPQTETHNIKSDIENLPELDDPGPSKKKGYVPYSLGFLILDHISQEADPSAYEAVSSEVSTQLAAHLPERHKRALEGSPELILSEVAISNLYSLNNRRLAASQNPPDTLSPEEVYDLRVETVGDFDDFYPTAA